MSKIFKYLIYGVIFILIWYIIFSSLSLGKISIIMLPQEFLKALNHKKNVIYSIASAVILFIAYILLTKSKIDDNKLIKLLYSEKYFILFLFVVGLIVSILIPIFQIPDERTHINMAFSEMNQTISIDNYASAFLDLNNRLPGHYNEKVNIYDYLNSNDTYNPSFAFIAPGIGILKHFPQIIGLFICSFLNLPTLITFTICELLALIFYCFTCWLSLKLIPIKKPLMMGIMAIPVCIQQMASFSYDAVLLPMCFLFFAYFLNLKFVKKEIKISDFLILLAILFVIMLIKFPYILIGGIIFATPLKKLKLNFHFVILDYKFINKHKIKIIFIAILLIGLLGVIFITTLLKGLYFKILTAALCNILVTVKLILKSILTNWNFYITTLFGNLCNFDTPVSPLFILFCILGLFLFEFFDFNSIKKNNLKFAKWETILFIILALILIVMLILALFEWSIMMDLLKENPNANIDISNFTVEQLSEYLYKIQAIEGVQGRYFVPVLPLLLLPWRSKKITDKLEKTNYKFFTEFFYLSSSVYVIYVIILRFWIA